MVHSGAHSLRVSSDEPSDTALGQDIALTPSAWYRFTGWVKTQGLERVDAKVSGTFQVQRSADRSAIAVGREPPGEHALEPRRAGVSVACGRADPDRAVLIGYGKGRGTAWFDAMAIERIDPADAPVIITRDFLAAGRINPYQYGQFIEYLCTMVPAMWAEKLFDGSFEGLSPYKVAYLKETDFRERPWYPSGATNRANFERDRTTKVSGDSSYKIALGWTNALHGLDRPGWNRHRARNGLRLCVLSQAERGEGKSQCQAAPRWDCVRVCRVRRDRRVGQAACASSCRCKRCERHAHDRVSRARVRSGSIMRHSCRSMPREAGGRMSSKP